MLIHKDCKDFLRDLEPQSIHGVVTDPPYEIGFMNKGWDSSGIAFDVEVWDLLYEVLFPGSHVIAFGFPTNYDLLVTALRLAGFDIRDTLVWHYGTGMPKGRNIGRDLGEETIQGQMWHDWHSCLKPATEFAVLAQKPIEEGLTIAQNCMKYGVGALNIGAVRVPTNPSVDDMRRKTSRKERISATWREGSGFKNEDNEFTGVLPEGRFASGVVFQHHPDCVLVRKGDQQTKLKVRKRPIEPVFGNHGIYGKGNRPPIEIEYPDPTEIWACVPQCPVRMLDDQAGKRYASSSISGKEPSSKLARDSTIYSELPPRVPFKAYGDKGGVSRFFYCPKASWEERDAGLPESFKQKNSERKNPHVSIKPLNLIRNWLRMILRPQQTVADFFVGSGTTAIAAALEGMRFKCCDSNHLNIQIAHYRLDYWLNNGVMKDE